MKRYELLALLLELAKQGCARSPVKIEKTLIASNLEISAWTLNKWLRESIELGYVEVTPKSKRGRYVLTPKAIGELSSLLGILSSCIKGVRRLILNGKVFSGLGEGELYTSLDEYKDWFRRLLGFEPYPGTLNLRLDPESITKRKLLESYDCLRIPPISREDRNFCGAKVFRAIINRSIEAGIVIPDKTVYGPDVLELVSKVCLREMLALKDGDIVRVEVLLSSDFSRAHK
ncbi:MAG: DUF120 domain-containing protein [Thermofilaceae archaeon]